MKFLELFSGSHIMSDTFKEKGWDTLTVDIEERYDPDICLDFNDLTISDIAKRNFLFPDVIWASPPCNCFSIASCYVHWGGGKKAYIPKTERAKESIIMNYGLKRFIEMIHPKIFFIENPRGIMRKMDFVKDYVRYTVTYCQYGDNRMKPTDIFSNISGLEFKKMCKNGDPCHLSAKRGSKTGTQGLSGSFERARIPKELCVRIEEICSNFD